MSSDIFVFDGSYFSDPFSPFSDFIPVDNFLQAIPDNNGNPILENPVDEIDQIVATLLSSSPPSQEMENLCLSQNTHLANASNSSDCYADFSTLGVKTEECQIPFYSPQDYKTSFGNSGNAVVKMMQRSFSSNSPCFLFHPGLDSLIEYPSFTENISSSGGHMRRVCSTRDLHSIIRMNQRKQISLSSGPLSTENPLMEEANPKVGRYSAEERKERIHRYRAKRTQRNFNKTIKYACRKTLADSRPRVRGRFARNDEAGEISKTATFNRYEDEDDDLWIHEEEDNGDRPGRGPSQFQYYYGY